MQSPLPCLVQSSTGRLRVQYSSGDHRPFRQGLIRQGLIGLIRQDIEHCESSATDKAGHQVCKSPKGCQSSHAVKADAVTNIDCLQHSRPHASQDRAAHQGHISDKQHAFCCIATKYAAVG